jgi:hypothetical protein
VTDTGWTKDLEGPFAGVNTAAAHQHAPPPLAAGVSTATAHQRGQTPFAAGVSAAAAHQSGQQPFTAGVSTAAVHQRGQQPFTGGVSTAAAAHQSEPQPFAAGGAHFLLATHSSGGSRFATAALAFSAADFLPCDARRTTHSFVASLQSHGMLIIMLYRSHVIKFKKSIFSQSMLDRFSSWIKQGVK